MVGHDDRSHVNWRRTAINKQDPSRVTTLEKWQIVNEALKNPKWSTKTVASHIVSLSWKAGTLQTIGNIVSIFSISDHEENYLLVR